MSRVLSGSTRSTRSARPGSAARPRRTPPTGSPPLARDGGPRGRGRRGGEHVRPARAAGGLERLASRLGAERRPVRRRRSASSRRSRPRRALEVPLAIVAFRDEERDCGGSRAFVARAVLPEAYLELHVEQGPDARTRRSSRSASSPRSRARPGRGRLRGPRRPRRNDADGARATTRSSRRPRSSCTSARGAARDGGDRRAARGRARRRERGPRARDRCPSTPAPRPRAELDALVASDRLRAVAAAPSPSR